MVSSTLALLLFFPPDFQIVSRAVFREEQCPVECRGYFVSPSVRPSICSSEEALACGLRSGVLAWGPWPGKHGLKALALAWRPGYLEALAQVPWPGGPGLGALAWGP